LPYHFPFVYHYRFIIVPVLNKYPNIIGLESVDGPVSPAVPNADIVASPTSKLPDPIIDSDIFIVIKGPSRASAMVPIISSRPVADCVAFPSTDENDPNIDSSIVTVDEAFPSVLDIVPKKDSSVVMLEVAPAKVEDIVPNIDSRRSALNVSPASVDKSVPVEPPTPAVAANKRLI
jgi:hypothetical protein